MKEPFKKKTKDRQGLRYKVVKSNKELDRFDDKWVEDEVEEYESRQREQPKHES